ncbi:MAG: hypothetical protein GVY28_12675 [Alphaproteobacteria bacterium]|jgi:hypothetical protein|nr:hypothetical protein [Alphaproteobacteria bacterium]
MSLLRVCAYIAASVAAVGLVTTLWLTAPSDPVSSPLARIWKPDPPAPSRSEGGPSIHWGGSR